MLKEQLTTSLSQLPSHSRIWIYAAERALSPQETETVKTTAEHFARQWVSHNQQLRSASDLIYNRFLILAVDQSSAGASGCSIDSSVHFVQRLGGELQVDFFNRMVFHYQDADGRVHSVAREAFQAAYQTQEINDQTLVFDPLVSNLEQLQTSFLKPLGDSWHTRMV
ncbi:MAG: hypothetical protein AAF433_11455 [Bacteroidota bacterium]